MTSSIPHSGTQATSSWRRRSIKDMIFELSGHGWHASEFQESIGYRWTGPGKTSSIQLQFEPNSCGIIEIHVFAVAVPAIWDNVDFFLNGSKLIGDYRQEGRMIIFSAPYTNQMVTQNGSSDLWIVVKSLQQEDIENGRILGIAISYIVIEPHIRIEEGSADLTANISELIGTVLFNGAYIVDVKNCNIFSQFRSARGWSLEVSLNPVSIGNWLKNQAVSVCLSNSARSPRLIMTWISQETSRVSQKNTASVDIELIHLDEDGYLLRQMGGNLLNRSFSIAMCMSAPHWFRMLLKNHYLDPELQVDLIGFQHSMMMLRRAALENLISACEDATAEWFPLSDLVATKPSLSPGSASRSMSSKTLTFHSLSDEYAHVHIIVNKWSGISNIWSRLDFKVQLFAKRFWIELRATDCIPPIFDVTGAASSDGFGAYVRCSLDELAAVTTGIDSIASVPVSSWKDIIDVLQWVCGVDDLFRVGEESLREGHSWTEVCWTKLRTLCDQALVKQKLDGAVS
jgi:hypothetical protein